MKCTLISVGEMKNSHLKKVAGDYRGRLEHHLQVEEKHVRKVRRGTAKKVKQKEGQRLLGAVNEGSLVVAMTEGGKQMNSVEWARQINEWMVHGRQEVSFLIGGAHGLSRQVRTSADRRWSLSALTFPHEVAMMLMWEQLYRALTIIRKEPYHK